ncbi:LLM class flavin-dependent oxidoreductase [Haloplanus sp. GCM10025708]|uniref:LLM class flavin-dependent oxidoreductase n=1 Tax=Haloplanus sp. GCM10025708 TaxID=3252679 RepID=UPI003605BCD7
MFAPHEVYDPGRLLRLVDHAERAGFDSVWTSDHFHPWWHTDAHCGAAWPWLGAALERTDDVRVGTGVTAPVARYHPGLVAQTFATLESIYPGRVHCTLATGEALNEQPLGYEWPDYEERRRRLVDACEICRRLWTDGFVDYDGHYWDLDDARLYTQPSSPPPLYVAGQGPRTARVAGRYADGFLTLADVDTYEETLVPALEAGAEDAGRDPSDVRRIKQASVAFADDERDARAAIRPWTGSLAVGFDEPVSDPRDIEARGRGIPESEWDEWGSSPPTPRRCGTSSIATARPASTKWSVSSRRPIPTRSSRRWDRRCERTPPRKRRGDHGSFSGVT